MKTRIIIFLVPFLLFSSSGFSQENDSISLVWWKNLDSEWQRYFTDSVKLSVPIDNSDLDSIKKKVVGINIRGYVIYDLVPLKALSGQLTYLNVSVSLISSLEPLREMKELSTLICDSVWALRSIEPILELPKLTAIRLIKTEVPNDELKKLRARKEIAIMLKPSKP